MSEKIINEELVLIDLDVTCFETLIQIASSHLMKQGKVKSTFAKAVIEREKVFPTGLKTTSYNIAMPHTDSSHVIESGICFARTKHPITVSQMGDCETKFDASMFFVLAVANPNEYMMFLSKLMGLFQNEKDLSLMFSTKDSKDIVKVISKLTI